MDRIILHLDMDAFFAAIEERENPALRGKPIVIGADPKNGMGRGVVSTASYAARKFGIHSALPISQAWKLCPSPICAYLPVDMKLYGIVSERIMSIVREVVEIAPPLTPPRNGGEKIVSSPFEGEVRRGFSAVEQVSVDEAYVDVSFCGSYEKAQELAQKIKDEIRKRERLSCSVGIGPNKLIAKIASDVKKPDGLTIVRPEEVADFLAPMPVRRLPGVGPKMEMELHGMGIKTVADIRRGGAQGPALHHWGDILLKAQGIDDLPVVSEYEMKSLGHEITFDKDTHDQAVLIKTALGLCDEVLRDAKKERVLFRTITIRVRFDNFETHTSSHTLPAHIDNGTIMSKEVLKLLFPYFARKRFIRLLGVRVSNLKEVNT